MKLTATMKERILKEILSKKIKPLEEKNEEHIKAVTRQYVETQLGCHKSFIATAPQGFLPEANTFEVFFGKSWDERFGCVKLEIKIPVPASWWEGRHDTRIRVEDDSKTQWKKAFGLLKKDQISIENQKKEIIRETKSFLAGINTTKQLFDAFPEVVQFVNAETLGKVNYPVMKQPDSLKKLLNL